MLDVAGTTLSDADIRTLAAWIESGSGCAK